jgi:hypothetical protein
MSNFSQWKRQAVEERFQLKEVDNHLDLLNWLAEEQEIAPLSRQNLLRLRKEIMHKIHDFNEWELAVKVIGKIIQEVNFDGMRLRSFSQRELKAVVDGEELSGKPDWMIATGSQDPRKPFFFLQEHKKTIDSDGDPMGQCLAAMLAAQEINQNHEEILYGGVVVGADWYFMILKNKEYSISLAYSVTWEEVILKIYQILKTLKIRIFTSTGESLDN